MKKRNILLVLLMTVSFVVHAHGDKQKDKGMLKGLDTPAAKVVLAFHEALETSNKELARAQLADDVTIYEGSRVERSADEGAACGSGPAAANERSSRIIIFAPAPWPPA